MVPRCNIRVTGLGGCARGGLVTTKGQAIVDMLNWALNDGQAYAPELDYAPLSPAAKAKALALVQSIGY